MLVSLIELFIDVHIYLFMQIESGRKTDWIANKVK